VITEPHFYNPRSVFPFELPQGRWLSCPFPFVNWEGPPLEIDVFHGSRIAAVGFPSFVPMNGHFFLNHGLFSDVHVFFPPPFSQLNGRFHLPRSLPAFDGRPKGTFPIVSRDSLFCGFCLEPFWYKTRPGSFSLMPLLPQFFFPVFDLTSGQTPPPSVPPPENVMVF